MLTQLRKGAATWLAKGLMALLVVAFALWGVDNWLRDRGQAPLAKVAGTQITPEQLRAAFQDRLQALSARLGGQQIGRDQARLFGIDERLVLAQMMGERVIDADARALGLGASQEAALDIIRKEPRFRGLSGSFNNEGFRAFLRQQGLSEAAYVERIRNALTREQLTASLIAEGSGIGVLADIENRFVNETRTIGYFLVPESAAGTIPEPDEAKIKAYYDANVRKFQTTERRKIAFIALPLGPMKKTSEVKLEDAEKEFNARKASFGTPEKRKLQQIIFKDKAAAEKGYQELKGGKDFLALAKELGLKDSDIELGEQVKDRMVDKKVAEAAFALPKGEPSQPVEGTFAVVIVRASEITAGTEKKFDEVKEQIIDQLATAKATDELQSLYDKIENLRSKGRNLKEIAEQAGIKVVEVAGVDAQGNGPDGKPAFNLDNAAVLLAKAFATDIGVESEAVELKGGGYAWVDVQGIEKAKPKPLADVKEDVKKAYLDEEVRKALRSIVQKLVDRLQKGEALEAVAKDAGAKVETSKPVKRSEKVDGLPPDTLRFAFGIKKGGTGQSDAPDGKSRLVFKVVEVTTPPPAAKESHDKSAKAFARQFSGDLLNAYVVAAEKRVGSELNHAALKRLFDDSAQ